MLGAGVWEDVSGHACQSTLNPCNLSLLALHLQQNVHIERFQAKDFARAHYCIPSLLKKISKGPGAKDTSLGVNSPTEQIDC